MGEEREEEEREGKEKNERKGGLYGEVKRRMVVITHIKIVSHLTHPRARSNI